MKTARNVAGHYNHSSQAAESLKAVAVVMSNSKTSIDNDVVTRFWSTYKFCSSMIILKQAIISLEDKTPESCHMSNTDWLVIQCATVVLEPFMMVQELLEGEKYVTISLIIPLIYDLRNKLKRVVDLYTLICNGSDATGVALKVLPTATKMLEVFNEKFGDGSRICSYDEGPRRQPRGFFPDQVCATALDPRTKDLVGVPESEKQTVWDLLKQRVVSRMMQVQAQSMTVGAGPSPPEVTASDTVPVPQKRAQMVLQSIFNAPSQPSMPNLPQPEMSIQSLYEGVVAEEISRYRAEVPLQFFDDNGVAQSPLDWWRRNEKLYPSLSKYAKRVLAIPATSAPSERVFSVAGQIVTKKRARLTGDAVTLLVWLKGAWEAVDEYVKEKASKKRRIA